MKKNIFLFTLFLFFKSNIPSQQSSGTFSLNKIFSKLTPSQGYTSGRCNKPTILSECKLDTSLNYGFYSVFDKNLSFKESFIANITVSFKKTPWSSKNKDQVIELIVISHKTFNYLGLGFKIGDSKSKIIKGRKYVTKNDLIKIDMDGYICVLKFNNNESLIKYLVYRNCSENESFQNNWYKKSMGLL